MLRNGFWTGFGLENCFPFEFARFSDHILKSFGVPNRKGKVFEDLRDVHGPLLGGHVGVPNRSKLITEAV